MKKDCTRKGKILTKAMEIRKEAIKDYKEKVFNKQKPKWLFAQVASHSFSEYIFLWIDDKIEDDVHLSNLRSMCQAGFDVFPFECWTTAKQFINSEK